MHACTMLEIIITRHIIMRHIDICNGEMNLNLNLFHMNKPLMRAIAIEAANFKCDPRWIAAIDFSPPGAPYKIHTKLVLPTIDRWILSQSYVAYSTKAKQRKMYCTYYYSLVVIVVFYHQHRISFRSFAGFWLTSWGTTKKPSRETREYVELILNS